MKNNHKLDILAEISEKCKTSDDWKYVKIIVLEYKNRGTSYIKAIKQYRIDKGSTLKEAKEAIDKIAFKTKVRDILHDRLGADAW
jgi:ribosomal protein L7/L12